MTAICGIAGPRPRDLLDSACRTSIEAQNLYSRSPPRLDSADGASFAAAIYPTTQEDFNEQQPLRTGSTLLVADSRLDNRAELIAAVGDPSLGAHSPDSAILLAGWSKWKHRLFERLIGSFAIAIYDRKSAALVLARAPFGDRPLCYRVIGDCVQFASMPSGLLQDCSFSPDFAALARFMVCGDMALGETAFEGVRAVPPAHYLEWTPRGSRLVRHWHPPHTEERSRPDVIDEFRHVLNESVGCRLRRTGGRVATHLSSGFDSSGVTATAAKLMDDPRDLVAFTMAPAAHLNLSTPPRYRADETALAAETARRLGIEQRIISHSGPLLDCLRDHARVYQAPVPNVTNHGWGYAIDERAAAAGARVLLSATMGNATLSYGAIDSLSEWLKRGRLLHYLKQARGLVRSGSARWRGAIFYSITDYVPEKLWMRLAGFPSCAAADLFIAIDWMKQVEKDKVGSSYRARGLRQAQYSMYARGDPGLFTKGTLAKSGLDERDPAADRRLVDFCLRLPAEEYLDDGVTKRLARRGLADRLPASIIDNQIRGYQGADWFAKINPRSALEWIEELKASPSASELLDLAALEAATTNWSEIARMPPMALRHWGHRFTRALAVGAFLRDGDREFASFGRRLKAGASEMANRQRACSAM